MKFPLALLLFTILSFSLQAQKAPIKWGKIDQADLEMTSYEQDPEVEAVVLADYASLHFDLSSGDILYKMEHHIRIKILKKSAFERGDISIPYYSYGKKEKISGLKAKVYQADGTKFELSKKDIYEEQNNEYWTSKKFALPGLKEGCIFEYKYTKTSDQIYFLDDWYFQVDIPTRYSELRTNIPEWFTYFSFNQGLKPQKEQTEASRLLSVPRQTTQSGGSTRTGPLRRTTSSGKVDARVVQTRYILENIPGLKPEPYITTMTDYYAKISLQLQTVKFPNSIAQNVLSSWNEVARNLYNSSSFGDQINKKRFTKKLMAAVKPNLTDADSDTEKVAKFYSYISNNIVWDETYGTSSSSLEEAFEKKSATSGELNLMLLALCKQSGIEAHPVLISTRSHGKPLRHYPKIDQFNHVLAFINVDGKELLFDVGSALRDPSLLRSNSLNYIGWLVDKDNPQWIDLPQHKDTEVTMATFNLDQDGTLDGTISQSFKGYCAMTNRDDYYTYKEEDHKNIREFWQESFPDIKINSISFKDEDQITKPLKCDLEVNIPQVAQVSDDFIYLSPMLGLGYDENPLKLKDRTFPIDISYQTKDQYILNLTIPDGYVVEELPEAINMKMEGDGGRFQFLVSQNGNTLQVVSKVILSKVHYEPEEYGIIRGFFDLIVEKQGEQIVLKKGA